MKKKQIVNEDDSTFNMESGKPATVFGQLSDIQFELGKSMGLPLNRLAPKSGIEFPRWCSKILEQFKKTILKPIVKLRQNGAVNWRNYGKMIGIIVRFKTFLSHDLPQILQDEGWDKMSDEQWEKIKGLLGETQLRRHLMAIVKRPISDDEPLEKLAEEVLKGQCEHFENLINAALFQVAQQDARTGRLFFKGMSEGYTCFLDENGGYCGDRGRTKIYMEFLVYRVEVERYRRTLPIKSRRDLQSWVLNHAKIRIPNDDDWFDHFCDEICLPMKGVGRKPKPQIL